MFVLRKKEYNQNNRWRCFYFQARGGNICAADEKCEFDFDVDIYPVCDKTPCPLPEPRCVAKSGTDS